MERTQIYLTEEQATTLDGLAVERGVTRSHLIREAIDATYLSPRRSQRDRLLAVLEELGAPWADRTDLPGGETYVERIRIGLPVSAGKAWTSRPTGRASSARSKP